jgi:hypothetical protein
MFGVRWLAGQVRSGQIRSSQVRSGQRVRPSPSRDGGSRQRASDPCRPSPASPGAVDLRCIAGLSWGAARVPAAPQSLLRVLPAPRADRSATALLRVRARWPKPAWCAVCIAVAGSSARLPARLLVTTSRRLVRQSTGNHSGWGPSTAV